LDIVACAVRMVQLRRDSTGITVVKAAVMDIAPWGDDPQLRRIHTVQAILQGLADWDISTKFVVCGLRGPEVVVRDFEFPALPPEEIEGAVQLEVSQICPFLAEESTLDYQVTLNTDQKTMGFWVAATNSLIENTRQLVSEAGLQCVLADVAGLALLNLLNCGLKEAADDNPIPVGRANDAPAEAGAEIQDPPSTSPGSDDRSRAAVLNLGDSCATIAIADHAGRPFVRDIACSVLADGRPSMAAARRGTSGSFSAEDGWAARNNYRSVTSDALVEDVATTLRYYAAQNGSVRVDRLLVCGGSPDAGESMEMLRMKLNIEVEPWDPTVDCGFRTEDRESKKPLDANSQSEMQSPKPILDPAIYGPSMAVAAGLAMRQV